MHEMSRKLLLAMLDSPDASQADLAKSLGVSKASVNNWLNRLKADKLVENTLGKWSASLKGRKAVGWERPNGMPSVQTKVNVMALN